MYLPLSIASTASTGTTQMDFKPSPVTYQTRFLNQQQTTIVLYLSEVKSSLLFMSCKQNPLG